ncbi:MAG: radical SAM protein [Bryobacteraceae bacterium]
MRSELIGIARLAASAPTLESKRVVDYRQLPSYQLLNRSVGGRVPFEWTINPYRGCEFACRYCYARYTHEFMELREPDQFDNLIFAKQWNPESFRRSLRRVAPGERIAIGTATDPYQPAERRFGLMRSILAELAAVRDLQVLITTKSDLIMRDLDLLKAIARNNGIRVNHTVTTMDAELARRIEPRAPRPDLRLRALKAVASAGIPAGVSCAPVLPLLNDSEASLDAVAKAGSHAGARWLRGGIVFLREPARGIFLDLLRSEYPALAAKYEQRFQGRGFLRGAYVEMITARIDRVRARHGLQGREPGYAPAMPPQYAFDFGAS